MLKHTMLFCNLERLALLGEEVAKAIREATPKDRELVGAVARPNYYCSKPQPLTTSDGSTVMVACGKTVPFSPLLQLVLDNQPTKEWVCESCQKAPAPVGGAPPAPGGEKPVRCLS